MVQIFIMVEETWSEQGKLSTSKLFVQTNIKKNATCVKIKEHIRMLVYFRLWKFAFQAFKIQVYIGNH